MAPVGSPRPGPPAARCAHAARDAAIACHRWARASSPRAGGSGMCACSRRDSSVRRSSTRPAWSCLRCQWSSRSPARVDASGGGAGTSTAAWWPSSPSRASAWSSAVAVSAVTPSIRPASITRRSAASRVRRACVCASRHCPADRTASCSAPPGGWATASTRADRARPSSAESTASPSSSSRTRRASSSWSAIRSASALRRGSRSAGPPIRLRNHPWSASRPWNQVIQSTR